jgi:hypothetical protein
MRRLGVKRVAGLEAVYPCQILQLLGYFFDNALPFPA